MRLERMGASWGDLLFESKAQSHQLYADQVTENMAKASIKQALIA